MKFIHLVPSAFLLLQFGGLALGMTGWLGGEDDEEDAATGGADFDRDDDIDEEFGGLDGMDDGVGGEDAGQNVTELPNRIEQLETEMANVSSKANTVRSENEQISESVNDVEENVRKLLAIYEMVTRGVNSFDDVQSGGRMVEGRGTSFGLFDGGENPDDESGDHFIDDGADDGRADAGDDLLLGDDEHEADDAFEDLDETDGVDEAATGADESGRPPEPTSAIPASGLRSTGGSDTPHLQEPPVGYLADVVVFEWLTELLDEFGPRNTVRTLNYYERIGWISADAREHLFTVLEGLSDSDEVNRQELGTTELTMDDYLRSLEYIEELVDGDLERGIIERCENLHVDGIQR